MPTLGMAHGSQVVRVLKGTDDGASSMGSGRVREALAGDRLWMLGAQSAWSLVDQGLTALTGFCVTFLLARWLAPDIYGAYAIAFAGYLFVSGLHNVIVLEPMSVIGSSRHVDQLAAYFRGQMGVHAVLVGACSVGVICVAWLVWRIAPNSPLGGAIAGSGLALPFMLLLFVARRICYVRRCPRVAALGSGCCLALTIAGLYGLRYLNHVSPFLVFILVGMASFAGSYEVLRRIGVSTSAVGAIGSERTTWRFVLIENWRYGRWLVGSTILYSISGQVQMFLAAGLLGLGAAGILRAMMLPASVMTQAVTAAGLLVLPGLSYDFGRGFVERVREKALIVSWVLCVAGICFAGGLWAVDGSVEHLLFGGKFAAHAWLMPVLATIPAANGLTMGFSAALRVSQKPHLDLIANAIAAPVAVISAVSLMRLCGIAGAAGSMVTGSVAYMGMNCCFFYAQPGARCEMQKGTKGAVV
jgi:hypothetical protein